MDPNLLEPDEIQIELSIRSLDNGDGKAIDRLRVALLEEAIGQRQSPTTVHSQFRTVNSEAAELQKKLSTIDLKQGAESLDSETLAKYYNRLLHLSGRVFRLPSNAATNAQVLLVRENIESAIKVVETAIKSRNKALNQEVKCQAALAGLSLTDSGSSSVVANGSSSTVYPNTTTAVSNEAPAGRPSMSQVISGPPVCAASASTTNSAPLGSGIPNAAAGLRSNFSHEALPVSRSSEMLRSSAFIGGGSHGWSMVKWPLRFGGGKDEMPVDEFIFRAETLARLANLSQAALTLGLHQILTNSAATWYWIYIRNEPNATWPQVKAALNFAFQSNVSDAAIRRLISDRLQRQGERFMEFCIAIQGLEVRLTHRMSEAELLDTLRRNMLPGVQDRLLFVPVVSVFDLQQRVQQVEELVQRQAEVQHFRKPPPKVHEISALPFNQTQPVSPGQPFSFPITASDIPLEGIRSVGNPFMSMPSGEFLDSGSPSTQHELVCAFDNGEHRRQYTICWNCDDLGHTYVDCAAVRRIFCYGCGAKNVVRPQCHKCSVSTLQGNGRRSVRPAGTPRTDQTPGGQTFQPATLNLPRNN